MKRRSYDARGSGGRSAPGHMSVPVSTSAFLPLFRRHPVNFVRADSLGRR